MRQPKSRSKNSRFQSGHADGLPFIRMAKQSHFVSEYTLVLGLGKTADIVTGSAPIPSLLAE